MRTGQGSAGWWTAPSSPPDPAGSRAREPARRIRAQVAETHARAAAGHEQAVERLRQLADLATGLYILNSGQSKAGVKGEHAAQLQGMAANAFPEVGKMDPESFAALLSTTEMTLGAALLAVPLVPPLVAGLALLGFAGGLNLLYLRTPGLRHEGTLKPTPEGIGIAKDFWMTAIGSALVLDSILASRRRR